jgi:hypothetical protein
MRPPRKIKTKANALHPRPRIVSGHNRIRGLAPSLGARILELIGCQRDSFLPVTTGAGISDKAAQQPKPARFKYKAHYLAIPAGSTI